MMQAILHGKEVKDGGRGRPPASVAAKYSSPGKSAPEQSGEDRGGDWNKKKKHKRSEETEKSDSIRHRGQLKGNRYRSTPEKGVHSQYNVSDKNTPGESMAGGLIREGIDGGKEGHKLKLQELKNMPKPKLPKDRFKKSFEQYYSGRGAGVIVTDDEGKVLVGKGRDGKWQTPGGHVDRGEDFDEAAHRELREEAGIVAGDMTEIGHFKMNGNDSKVFVANSFKGNIKDSEELKDLKFVDIGSLLDWDMRDCSLKGIQMYAHSALKKSKKIKDMLVMEKLEKNIMRGGARDNTVFDISHGDSLRLVGNGAFRFLKRAVEGMEDEDFRDVMLDGYTISIRKHMTDVYSGRINNGHKTIHQFTNKSLPQLTADVMSVFEWYSGDDENVFDILDEQDLPDDAIMGGLSQLSDNYKKHNLANIYTEMNNIRQEIRNDSAVDIQQVEHRIMKLFDKLEESVHEIAGQHNKLTQEAGNDVEILENKLRELQMKVDELNSKPSTVEAIQTRPVDSDKVYGTHYMYLPKPTVKIGANGNVTITFDKDWTDMEKSNFLNDMKAKIVKNKRR